MDISSLYIMVNVALVVLILMVQFIVYPSFYFYSEIDLKRWHQIYKVRITAIVLPLMLTQLFLSIREVYFDANALAYLILFIILLTWVITFLISVPLHEAIEREENSMQYRIKLVRTNWIRTVSWALIMILSILNYGT
jgi:hypothetical protein